MDVDDFKVQTSFRDYSEYSRKAFCKMASVGTMYKVNRLYDLEGRVVLSDVMYHSNRLYPDPNQSNSHKVLYQTRV